VCDLGKLAVAAFPAAPIFDAIRTEQARAGGSWLAAERLVLGYDHTQVGTRLLETWRFPSGAGDGGAVLLSTLQAPSESRALLAHLHAAKYLAISFGPGVAEDGFHFELNEPFLLEWGFTSEFLQEMLPVVWNGRQARLREKLTHGAVALSSLPLAELGCCGRSRCSAPDQFFCVPVGRNDSCRLRKADAPHGRSLASPPRACPFAVRR